MNETNMIIRLEELLSSEDYLPPDDPLGELTSFELGIRRFCYDQNRHLSIVIGNESKEVFLFPDICLLIERLPAKIAALSHGQPIELEFGESWFSIELWPTDESVIGTLSEYGQAVVSKRFELNLAQVLHTLRVFSAKIVQLAVDGQYITQEEADEFLGKTPEVNGFQRHGRFMGPSLPLFYAGEKEMVAIG